eukprot:2779108-Rhodomonas_salina.1
MSRKETREPLSAGVTSPAVCSSAPENRTVEAFGRRADCSSFGKREDRDFVVGSVTDPALDARLRDERRVPVAWLEPP